MMTKSKAEDNQQLQNAVRKMIQVELDAMHYYLKATEAMQDENAIFHFSLLAQEEMEHARSFYDIYPGDDLPDFDKMVREAGKGDHIAGSIDVGLMSRIDERQALQLALKLEKEVEGNLRRMAEQISSPAAVAVIFKNADSTLNHYQMIEDDYKRLYGELS